jgi:hypothetical protein
MCWVLLDVSGQGLCSSREVSFIGNDVSVVCWLCCTRCHGSNLSGMCGGWFLVFISVVMLYMVF